MHIYIQYKAIYFTIRCENKGGVLFIKFLVAILFTTLMRQAIFFTTLMRQANVPRARTLSLESTTPAPSVPLSMQEVSSS